MDKALQDRILKDIMPVDASELAPEPVITMFKSYRLDINRGIDPISGMPIITLAFTSGNFAQQLLIPMTTLQASAVVRDLSKAVNDIEGEGGNGAYS